MGRRVHGEFKKNMSTKFFTIVFVLCMLSAFNCGILQGSENDFDKVANGIEAKLAAFKQKFKNIFAQKNLTEEQQHKVLGNLGKNFYEIVENANKKWKSFQGQLKKADNSTREHMMKKFHEITEKVHEIEDIGEDEEKKKSSIEEVEKEKEKKKKKKKEKEKDPEEMLPTEMMMKKNEDLEEKEKDPEEMLPTEMMMKKKEDLEEKEKDPEEMQPTEMMMKKKEDLEEKEKIE